MKSFVVHRAVTFLLLMTVGATATADESSIAISAEEGSFHVSIGDEPFCDVDFRTYEKPIVYPIFGPGQVPMTRNYPMQKGVPNEATDHPHHKSMWFGHGDVNGVSFWHGEGKIVNESAELIQPQDGPLTIRLISQLLAPQGELVGRETMELSFGAAEGRRWIDWDITVRAGDQELKFGDTKEGTAALRVHPNLRLDNDRRRDVTAPNGHAINSEGVTGPAIWGKRAKWVDYWGTIEGQTVGIAFFDNPQNLRYPTYWHARDYGLYAANPFGLSEFVGRGEDGSYTVPAGGALRLRYRLVFHTGDVTQAKIAELYQEYVGHRSE